MTCCYLQRNSQERVIKCRESLSEFWALAGSTSSPAGLFALVHGLRAETVRVSSKLLTLCSLATELKLFSSSVGNLQMTLSLSKPCLALQRLPELWRTRRPESQELGLQAWPRGHGREAGGRRTTRYPGSPAACGHRGR